jgi:hypothetical protein
MHVEHSPSIRSASRLIEDLAGKLTEIRRGRDALTDQKSWDMATAYVMGYGVIAETIKEEAGQEPSPQQVNRRIRAVPNYEGPGGSWLSNAKRTYTVFPEVFNVNIKNLPYDSYRQIAVCSLPERTKIELREWAERERPKQADLRERIRSLVVGMRPDFDLKFTNFWRFNRKLEASEFDGGIHPDLVANLIYYFTDPGDTILDPMAGGDTTNKVLQKFEFFHAINPGLDHSGPRSLKRFDVVPVNGGISHCDVREIDQVVDPRSIDLCILDPPYWRVADGKYDIFGESIEEWRDNIGKALQAVSRTLKTGGVVAVIVDDFLRSKQHQPLAIYIGIEAEAVGYTPRATIYNTYPHAVASMDAKMMWRCKRTRLMVNECKIVQVFEVIENAESTS